MIGLLAVLSAVYLVVLALVLVVTLSIILVYARRIGDSLAQVAENLQVAERHTAPLAEKLDALNGGLAGVQAGLAGTAADLAAADASLAELAGEAAPGAERAA
jgi:hypothetical protein